MLDSYLTVKHAQLQNIMFIFIAIMEKRAVYLNRLNTTATTTTITKNVIN